MNSSWDETLVAGLVGFGSAVLAEPARAWLFRSRIKISFAEGGLLESNVIRTPSGQVQGEDAKYVRLQVTNPSGRIAREVRVFLIRIDVQGFSGEYVKTAYADAVQLGWSGQTADRYSSFDLPPGVTAFVDALSANAASDVLRVATSSWPAHYNQFLFHKGVYRFTFLATGENTRPSTARLAVPWSGIWDSLRMATRD